MTTKELYDTRRTIRLYGELGVKFGRVHRLAVETTAEAIRALCALHHGFEAYMMNAKDRGYGFAVFLGKRNIDESQLDFIANRDIRIAPIILGSKSGGIFSIILGAALIAVSFLLPGGSLLAAGLFNAGLAMALGGVVQLLSPQPKDPKSKDKEENAASYAFNGPVNTQAQGNCVPVAYGKLVWTGSAVISAGIDAGVYVDAPAAPEYALGFTGGVNLFRVTDDNGDNFFEYTTIPEQPAFNELRHGAASGSSVAAYSSDGWLYYSPNRGVSGTWVRAVQLSTLCPKNVWAMGTDNAGTLMAVCTDNGGLHPDVYIIKSTNGGLSWALVKTFLAFTPTNSICYGLGSWVIGTDLGKYHSPDGINWSGPFGARAMYVSFTGTHFLSTYLVTQYATDVEDWNTVANEPVTSGGGRSICGHGTEYWLIDVDAEGQGIKRSNDMGASWSLVNAIGEWSGYQAHCYNDVAVFTDGGGGAGETIRISEDGGLSWNNIPTSPKNYSTVIFR